MDNSIASLARVLIWPGIFVLFGLMFLWAWALERRRPYLLLLALGCTVFASAAASQILGWPSGTGPNAIFSGFLYTVAVLATAEGMLLRSGKRLGLRLDGAILCAVTGLLWYFCYVAPNLLARIYVQNFGYGAILLMAALRLRSLRHERLVDRLLFWTLFGFSVQFFPRTIITVGFSAPGSLEAFRTSLFWNVLQFSLAIFGAGLAFLLLTAALTDVMDDLRRERDSDPLTGALNRRGLDERLKHLLRKRSGTSVSVIVCDIDHFKSVNDRFGHSAGDEVLRSFAQLLKVNVRSQDLVVRTGGEEFTIILPDADEDQAAEVAERIRAEFQVAPFEFSSGTRVMTASFGIAQLSAKETVEAAMERADQRLYAAKAGGRNTVVGPGSSEKTAHAGSHVRSSLSIAAGGLRA
ncbi:GGDEF domain-containing protein [Neorhizobium petrolearium]|uniref:diguanylate cyclase n=1 Tax=Neorhizobium petrolearium TaxID=515361 RepID=A0ABY8M5S7_9HYPH|nr:GGDEF domain-containing protein [Neorhizobium petrolearium]MCC2608852.1 GGDEF domain-containing protein [Neorhizobium petrolearium]WGI69101.1 GGDEF domain-containing protein [Neorhizobium petrolearium]